MRHLKLCWIPPPLKFMSQLIFFSKLGFAGTPPPVFETMSQNMQFFFWPASLNQEKSNDELKSIVIVGFGE